MDNDWLLRGAAENTNPVQHSRSPHQIFGVSAPLRNVLSRVHVAVFPGQPHFYSSLTRNGHIKAYSDWDASNLRLVL